MNKISVVIPIYNEEVYLEQCISSIQNQTYDNLEIILVDDGSQKSCADKCDEYAKRDNRIKVIHQENGGATSARKVGISVATGDYITFVDADDWIEPELCEEYSKWMCYNPDMISMTNFFRNYEDGSFVEAFHSETKGFWGCDEFESKILPKFIDTSKFYDTELQVSMCFYVFKSEKIKEWIIKWDNRIVLSEVFAFLFLAFFNSESFAITPFRGYHYRCNNKSKTFNITNAKEKYKFTYKWINEQIEHSKYNHQLLQEKNDIMVYLFFMNTDYRIVLKGATEYLHPYLKVKKGSRIIIYGNGQRGQKLFQALHNIDEYTVVGIADKRYGLSEENGYQVMAPSEIMRYDFDYVVLAIAKADMRNEIKQELIKIGVEEEKIAEPDINVIDAKLLLRD